VPALSENLTSHSMLPAPFPQAIDSFGDFPEITTMARFLHVFELQD
jgi:hypothetical protein